MTINRRMAGPGGMRRNIRSSGGVASGGSATTPETIFGSKTVEWWDAALDVGLVTGAVDSWTGQKRGVVLTAPAAGNRCTLNATDANFNGVPTVQGAITGSKCLRATGLSPALIPAASTPCVILVGRHTTAWSSGTQCFFDLGGAATAVLIYAANGTQQAARVRTSQPANSEIPVTVDITVPAITRREHQNGAGGGKHWHNATLAQADQTHAGVVNDVTTVGFACVASSGTLTANYAAAQMIVLDGIPSAGEWTAYKAYALATFGITA